MAVIWQKQINGSQYEVRTAGSSIRLYTDGIFHSQWNPNQPVGGNIWELLFLPALFIDPPKINRVLVLGVGGGAVINLLNRFISPATIVGVDLDAIHLKLARRHFGVDRRNTNLIQAEAMAWVDRYSGPSFDLVIEDLFKSDGGGEAVRAVAANKAWLENLKNMLLPGGVLVMNHESSRQVKMTAGIASEFGLFRNALQMKTGHYENAIGVFANAQLDRKAFNTRLTTFRELDRRFKTCKLDFSLRRL